MSFFLMFTLALSRPNRKPSGTTTAALPFFFKRYMITERKRSAVSELAKSSGRNPEWTCPHAHRRADSSGSHRTYHRPCSPADCVSSEFMVDIRNFNIMQQHIGHAQQIGKGLFLYSENTVIQLLLSGGVRYLFGELSQPGSDKSAGATGEVCHFSPSCGFIINAINSVTALGV